MSSSNPVVILGVKDELKLLGLRSALQQIEVTTAKPFTLRVESDLASALGAVREERPDLIVLDLDARSIDVWAFLDTMKRDASTRAIPIVAFSRDDTPVQAERAYTLHANAFAPRPETEEAWLDVVRGFVTFWLGPVIKLPKPPR